MSKQEITIKVYTTDSCPYCVTVKSYLQSKNIDFQEINLTKQPEEAEGIFTMTGSNGVPITMFDDKQFVIGFNRSQIDILLQEYKLI